MPEDITSPDGGATPNPGTPATGTAPVGATPQSAALTLEEALKRIAELEHSGLNAKEELDRHRKKVSGYEKAEAEREAQRKAAEEAQLSEIDRIKKQHAEIQAERESLLQELQQTRIQHAVMAQATTLNFIHPEIAAKLVDWTELEYNEQRHPTNTAKLLEKLAKAMPELVRAPQAPTQPESNTQPATPTQAASNAPALKPAPFAPSVPAMNPGRSNIPAPGSNPPGRIPRLADVWSRQK